MAKKKMTKEEVEALQQVNLDELNTNLEVTEKTVEIENEVRPTFGSPEWSDYVMSHFTEKELFNDYPKTDGLRRVASVLLGDIIDSYPEPVSSPILDSNGAVISPAVIKHVVKFRWFADGTLRTFAEIADVSSFNAKDEFSKHSTSTASTKAEGRALRKALQLRTLAAEEMETSSEMMKSGLTKPKKEGMIKDDQINFFDMVGSRKNVNIWKFLNMGEYTYKNMSDVMDIPFERAAKMCAKLSEMTVTDDFKGYDVDWKNKEPVVAD